MTDQGEGQEPVVIPDRLRCRCGAEIPYVVDAGWIEIADRADLVRLHASCLGLGIELVEEDSVRPF